MTYPILYKKSKTGTVVYCSITTADVNIQVETGQVGTEKPTFHHTTCEPKNVGRANVTTAEQQAKLEANSKHAKKIKSGYVLDPSGETDVRLPMKVKVYQDQLNNIVFPCYTSPKLDGVNYTVRLANDGKLTATSRGGESRIVPGHQVVAIKTIMVMLSLTELNGEQYIHGEFLQDIQSAVTKSNDMTKNLVLQIFDIPCLTGTWEDRLVTLDLIAKATSDSKCLQVVLTRRYVQSHKEIQQHFQDAVASGYEGIIIRNSEGLYKHNQRSSNVFKYKEALAAEFLTMGFNLDKHGHVVFHLQSDGGVFKAKPKGTNEQRLAMASHAEDYIGKWLTVEYESLTKYRKPSKPVGLCFRKCAASGEPLE